MLVKGAQKVCFNYSTFDRQTGLHVAGNVFDVTSGSPALVSQVPMSDPLGIGHYSGEFIPLPDHSYLIVSLVYTDSGFSSVDPDRAPEGVNFEAATTDNSVLNFNYGAFDHDSGLTVLATVYDLTTDTSHQFDMTHVLAGVYFGQFAGLIGKDYFVIKAPSDTDYAPGEDNFQTFAIDTTSIVNVIALVELEGPELSAELEGQSLVATLEAENA